MVTQPETNKVDRILDRVEEPFLDTIGYACDEIPGYIYFMSFTVMMQGVILFLCTWPIVAVHKRVTREKRKARAVIDSMSK